MRRNLHGYSISSDFGLIIAFFTFSSSIALARRSRSGDATGPVIECALPDMPKPGSRIQFPAQPKSLRCSMANKQQRLQFEPPLAAALMNKQTGGACQRMPAHISQRYEDIACDGRYQHFVRIPPRIVRCLDHFGIESNRTLVRKRLL